MFYKIINFWLNIFKNYIFNILYIKFGLGIMYNINNFFLNK